MFRTPTENTFSDWKEEKHLIFYLTIHEWIDVDFKINVKREASILHLVSFFLMKSDQSQQFQV